MQSLLCEMLIRPHECANRAELWEAHHSARCCLRTQLCWPNGCTAAIDVLSAQQDVW